MPNWDQPEYPPGVPCTSLTPPPGLGPQTLLGPNWYSWVDPTSCEPYESTSIDRATMKGGIQGKNKIAFDAVLADAVACCNSKRDYLASQQYLEDAWAEKCQEIAIIIDNAAPQVIKTWFSLPDESAWKQYVVARGGFAVKDPAVWQPLLTAYAEIPQGWRDWILACKPFLAKGIEQLAKTVKATVPPADKKAADKIRDDAKGAGGRRRQRQMRGRLDDFTRAWQEEKAEKAADALPAGQSRWILDTFVTGDDPEPPPPDPEPARNTALILGALGALVAGPPGLVGGAALGAYLDKQGSNQ